MPWSFCGGRSWSPRELSRGHVLLEHPSDITFRAAVYGMYSKLQRNLMLGYLGFVLLIMLVIHEGFSRASLTPIDLILYAPIPIGFGVFAIQNGWISTRYSAPIERQDSPVSFWFYVGFALLFGIGMFLWGVFDAIRSMR